MNNYGSSLNNPQADHLITMFLTEPSKMFLTKTLSQSPHRYANQQKQKRFAGWQLKGKKI